MRGWMNSSLTRRRLDRVFEKVAATEGEVARRGRAATTAENSSSFYTSPCDVDPLVSFDRGVPDALRQHLRSHGLDALAEHVGEIESLGRRLRQPDGSDHSVSAVVYQMH